jgi:hypothetical protein
MVKDNFVSAMTYRYRLLLILRLTLARTPFQARRNGTSKDIFLINHTIITNFNHKIKI